MERAIGEVFELDGVKLRVEKDSRGLNCRDCYFGNSFCYPILKDIGYCGGPYRKDNTDVVFTEVKE